MRNQMMQNGHSLPNHPRPRGAMNLRGALALLITVVVLGLVGWLYLSQASEAAELDRRFRELERQKEELLRQNDQLTYEIARLASVERLEKRAHELGYVAVRQARFVTVASHSFQDEAAPDDVTTVVQRDSVERATPLAMASWWHAVTDQFDAWVQPEQH